MKEADPNYFESLNTIMKDLPRAVPCMLIDMDRFDRNIDQLVSDIPDGTDLRIVAKSLPSIPMLEYIMKRGKTKKLMVFHQPFVTQLSGILDAEADLLFGKPMPVKTVEYYYKNLPEITNGFDPYKQIQWLVDTTERLNQYTKLARKLGKPLRINLETDVGLRRGGFDKLEGLEKALELIRDNPDELVLSGFMGYDTHVVKVPGILRSTSKGMRLSGNFYTECKKLLETRFPQLWRKDLCFNGGGSPTIKLHSQASVYNDISAGTCLVRPTTFDIPTLTQYEPAAFIATPILKALKGTTIPGLEKLASLLSFIFPSWKKTYFIYGGFWKADFCYPGGLKDNPLYGYSTNQSMVNAPAGCKLKVDDFVFLRPHQSEFVFLQFGDILAIRNGKLETKWPILQN